MKQVIIVLFLCSRKPVLMIRLTNEMFSQEELPCSIEVVFFLVQVIDLMHFVAEQVLKNIEVLFPGHPEL